MPRMVTPAPLRGETHMIDGFKEMPPAVQDKLNELREVMRQHGFAFGALFAAEAALEGHSVLWFVEAMPHRERLSMLRELRYCVRETLDFYERVL